MRDEEMTEEIRDTQRTVASLETGLEDMALHAHKESAFNHRALYLDVLLELTKAKQALAMAADLLDPELTDVATYLDD